MDIEQRKRAYLRLVESKDVEATAAVLKELIRAKGVLEESVVYGDLINSLEMLKIVWIADSQLTIEILRISMERFRSVDLVYQSSIGLSESEMHRIYGQDSVSSAIIEVAECMQYLETRSILDFLLESYESSSEKIREKICQSLKSIGSFDLKVFYGTEERHGIGPRPQLEAIDYLCALSIEIKRNWLEPIAAICNGLLSSRMEANTWSYDSVTHHMGWVPANQEIKELRQKGIELLNDLYSPDLELQSKIAVITTLMTATQTPYPGKYGDDVLEMIFENSKLVAQAFASMASDHDLQFLQKLEGNANWIFKARDNPEVKEQCLIVKRCIDENVEFDIFKSLIGFESVYGDWQEDQDREIKASIEYEKEYRSNRILEFVDSISEENIEVWTNRIISYSKIDSNDLATFPYFEKFLLAFSKNAPNLAMSVIEKSYSEIGSFGVPLMLGIWNSDHCDELRGFIEARINDCNYLYEVARLMQYVPNPDNKVLERIRDIAIAEKDWRALIQIISTAIEIFAKSDSTREMAKGLFLDSVESLTEIEIGYWVNAVWYNKNIDLILTAFDENQASLILNNLIPVSTVDYHVEEILASLAKTHPLLVVEFFQDRLNHKPKDDVRYDPIPFRLERLKETFADQGTLVVNHVRTWFSADNSLFQYKAARLLKSLYPEFNDAIGNRMMEMVKGTEQDVEFVISVIKSYDGEPFIDGICKEIVRVLPIDSELLSGVLHALINCGVVSGEYGMVNAYKQRIDRLEAWLGDDDVNVRVFSEKSIDALKGFIEREEIRVRDDIGLRKQRYGEGEE